MNIKTGDKAVCIDDRWTTERFCDFDFPNGLPVAGMVYLVTGTDRHNGAAAVLLLGFPAILCCEQKDWGYYAWRFRRVEEASISERPAVGEREEKRYEQ